MPVLVSDYSWNQSSSTVNITVPLKGVPSSHVDVFTSNNYIKAHFQPFLFEVFLLNDIIEEKSKCYLHETYIQFELTKIENNEWEALERKLTKEEKITVKKEIHQKCQENSKSKLEEKVVRKNELQRFTVQQAMAIDNKVHTLIDQRRNNERNRAMDDLEKWRLNQQEIKNHQHSKPTAKSKIIEIRDVEEPTKLNDRTKKPKTPKITVVKSEYIEKKKKEFQKRVLPPIRGTSEMEIVFSERAFPTPSRESTAEEEAIWLRKMVEARRATGFVSEDLRPEEQDPQWCKDKGDEFFRDGNFLGAISAYTHAIKLSDKWASLYANRAATHFALGNFHKCMVDCSEALELMKPACEGNRVSRARCLARRAAALARSGMLNKGIDEMKAAAKLLPNDEKIKKDIYEMERAWEQNPDSD